MNHQAVISVTKLSFAYGEQQVLEDVTLDVNQGEFLGVIGPNGGGKTTLLRVMLGLETSYAGSVKVFGETPHSSHRWRQLTGVVPQNRIIPPHFPVLAREVVEMGTQVRGAAPMSRTERHQRVEEAMDFVDAAAYADKPLWQLSGGQRQRIFVARALALKPELLLLDEPTVGVDARGQDLLLQWISNWRKTNRMTVVLVSHDIGVIAPLADTLACLNVRVHFHGQPDRLTGEALEQAYGCPAEVLFHTHVFPHRVLEEHKH
jgi:zinc transport system ATP-binding protein